MEKIWYQDPKHFISAKNFMNFIPNITMTRGEQLNAILRFSIYFTLIMYLINDDYRYIYVVIVFAALTAGISKIIGNIDVNHQQSLLNKNQAENFTLGDVTPCTAPTSDNPFMNPLLTDVVENPNRAPACNPNNKKIKNKITKNFDKGLFRSVGDLFHKESDDRMYYTVPGAKNIIGEGQTEFAKYLYSALPTCKETSLSCGRQLTGAHYSDL